MLPDTMGTCQRRIIAGTDPGLASAVEHDSSTMLAYTR